jgi:hypothetical protein
MYIIISLERKFWVMRLRFQNSVLKTTLVTFFRKINKSLTLTEKRNIVSDFIKHILSFSCRLKYQKQFTTLTLKNAEMYSPK